VLALPGEEVTLRARLQSGDLLAGQSGFVVRFYRDGDLYKAAETGADGAAVVAHTPARPGDEPFTAALSPNGFSGEPPEPVRLLVACRRPDAPLLVVDLDKTLVASGFEQVLIGDPDPMPHSRDVMKRIAARYTVVYLTHRPDYFGPKSKAWLRKQGYPNGPLLLSDIGGFLKGSEAFKSGRLKDLRERFKRLEVGIGDKISDARAYHDNGMTSFAIVRPGDETTAADLRSLIEALEALPKDVHVVEGWKQIESAIFGDARFPPSKMLGRVRAMLEAREKAEPEPATDEPGKEGS